MGIPNTIIPDNMAVLDVELWTEFDHTAVVDLQSFLWHQNETVILFGDDPELNEPGGCLDNDVDVIISDDSSNAPWEDGQTCDSGAFGIGGSHQPVDSLSIFDGTEANGDWIFFVHDQDINDEGVFGQWTLTLTLPTAFCTPSPTTPSPTTPSPATPSPTTPDPTTDVPTTGEPTTDNPTNTPTTVNPTNGPTTSVPTTSTPTTSTPTTSAPTTSSPTTSNPTDNPTTSDPTTAEPTSGPTKGPTDRPSDSP
eukprot:163556_1